MQPRRGSRRQRFAQHATDAEHPPRRGRRLRAVTALPLQLAEQAKPPLGAMGHKPRPPSSEVRWRRECARVSEGNLDAYGRLRLPSPLRGRCSVSCVRRTTAGCKASVRLEAKPRSAPKGLRRRSEPNGSAPENSVLLHAVEDVVLRSGEAR